MKTNHKLAFAKVIFHALRVGRAMVGLSTKLTARRREIVYGLDLSQGIDLYIYLFGAFEITTTAALQRLVKSGDTVVDIGANVGAHTLHLAKAVGSSGKVFAFEPTAFAYGKLQRNLALNPGLASSVTVVQCFLGDGGVSIPGSIPSSWPLASEAELHDKHGGELMATSGASTVELDRYLADANVARLDLIKLDVDGYECSVLAGARRSMERWKPIVVLELAPHVLEEQGTSVEKLLSFFIPLGYKLFKLDDSPLPANAKEICSLISDGESLNVIARSVVAQVKKS